MELALLILGLLLMLQSPRLRPYAWWTAGGLALALAVYYVYDTQQTRLAEERIGPERVLLSEAHMRERDFGVYELRGVLENRSEDYAVEQVAVRVTALHCPDGYPQTGCEARATAPVSLDLRIPPGQSQPFEERVYFEDIRAIPSSGLRWAFEVARVRAGG